MSSPKRTSFMRSPTSDHGGSPLASTSSISFSPSSTLNDQVTIPGYHLLERLGKGAFGTVHKAIKVGDGRLVAIKIIQLAELPQGYDVEKTMKEWSIMQELSHPNIVKVYDYLKTEDALCFVFDFIEGGSLYNIIKKFGTFPESLVAIYTEQVLRGLAYLHENGIVHSDIKAANLLIDKAGIVKLADFGIARKVSADDVSEQPMDPTALGSPFWMAPEVILMTGRSFASDIWALGCTVIELVSGDPPYIDLPAMTAMFRIVEEGKPPFPSGLSEDLRDFLEKCFVDEETKRATAKHLLEHRWLHRTSTEEKKKLAKSLSQKNLSQTVMKLKPPQVTQMLSSFEPDLAELLNEVPTPRKKSSIGADPSAIADALKKLNGKRGSLRKRITNLEKHQGEVSRLEKLYIWRGGSDQSPRLRLTRYKNYLQTVEEHIDKVKGSVYPRGKVIKDHRPQTKGGLKLKKGQIVFLHSNEGDTWTGEKQFGTKEGTFPADCVKILKPDKGSGHHHHRLFSTSKKNSADNTAVIDAHQALMGLEEDERKQEKEKPTKKNRREGSHEDMKAEIKDLRERVQQLEEKARKDAERIKELVEENKRLQDGGSTLRNSGNKEKISSPLKKDKKLKKEDSKEKELSPSGLKKKKGGSARETSPSSPMSKPIKKKDGKEHGRSKSDASNLSYLYG